MHGIVAHFLCDRNQLHAVLGELAHIELKLEVIAEEAAERMDHDDIEGRGFAGASLDHALELGAAVIGGRCTGFYKSLDQLQTTGFAIGFTLPLLVGNGDIMLGLPRRRNAQVKGRA
ncbi:hypothetical protein ATN00_04895 [Sphingobium baderi]|uniref:Uncharacterized protein n=1 Tax=Sphingobium baderi TaxID=1332080 RepID=A0A0S3EWJ8_9SPHN|nr:hypothetical protein ATN00_04895 [Sphingobium baderi]